MNSTVNMQYDKVYDIRLATISDIPMIMDFVNIHWKRGHIIATNRELFEYEYVHGREVDFVLAIKKQTGTLEAIFGFLRCSHDRSGDIWGSMWKVNDEGNNMNFLGIEIARRVYTLTGCRSHIGNGANPKTTVPLRKIFFREKTVKMKQYYWLNPNIDQYRIAIVNERWEPVRKKDMPSFKVKKFETYSSLRKEFDLDTIASIPRKDGWYINHRFFQHPIYHYDVYGICNKEKVCAIFVTREVSVNDASILRIVDYIGDHKMLMGIYDEISVWVAEHGYEYVDFFEYGISDEIMESAGFRNRDDFNNIIPNYFEPFVQENVDIWAHYKEEGTTFFKADGDQDRPNISHCEDGFDEGGKL